MVLAAVGAIVLGGGTAAAQAPSQAPIAFRIPAQPLADALNQLAQQSGLQILFPSELGAQIRGPDVTGSMSADDALRQLLVNTGLRFEFINARTVTIFGDVHAGSNVSTPPSTPSGAATPGATAVAPDSQKDSPASHLNGQQRSKGSRAGCGAAEHPGAACAQDDGAAAGPLEEIIVSARKRNESLAQLPASITVFSRETLQNYDIQSFNDYATKTPNLSFAYGGGPTGIADARTVAIRGITGQNLSGTAGATGFYIDDTPVPSSIDPRILDVDHIEVLKGPQGTLFGEDSLGGNVRIITQKPDLTANGVSFMAQAGITSRGGSPDGGGGFVGNLALIPDTLAIRVVLFINHDAGYLTRTYPTDPSSPGVSDPLLTVPHTSVGDQGAATSYGGSMSMLLKATDRLDATLRLMIQSTSDNGFPAAFAPLPSFTPDYTIDRAFNVQAHANDQWWLPSLDLKYHGQGWEFVSSSSFFRRHTQDVEDSTYGTQQILTGFYGVCCLPPQPYLWRGEHYEDQVSEEMRVSFDPVRNLSGTVGAFFSKTRSNFTIPPIDATGLVAATANNTVVGPWPNEVLWFSTNLFEQRDTSVFGEFYYEFLPKFTLTLGARQYWLSQSSSGYSGGFQDFSESHVTPETTNGESGFNPKVGLSYQATDTAMVYASASKGFRSGGAQGPAVFCVEPGLSNDDIEHVKADTLWSYEVGTRLHLPQPSLLVSADIFHIDWQNPQQQLALPCGAYFDINGRAATINGGEFDISGYLTPSLSVRMGAGYEKGDITEPGALIYAGIRPGSRILGTPAWNASVGGVYTQAITRDIDGFVSADYSFTGSSDALINGGNGAVSTRPAYSLVNMRFGIDHGQTEVSLNIHNLTNAKPNLGDIGYVGYAQYGSTGTVIPQAATLQPLTILLRYRKTF